MAGGFLGELALSAGSLLLAGFFIVLLPVAFLLWSRRADHPWNRRLAAAYALAAIGGTTYTIIGGHTRGLDEMWLSIAVPASLLTATCAILIGVILWPIVAQFLRERQPRIAGAVVGGVLALLLLARTADLVANRAWFGLEGVAYNAGQLLPITVGLVASAEATRRGATGGVSFWAAMFPFWVEAMLNVGYALHGPDFPSGWHPALIFALATSTRLPTTLWGLRAAGVSRTVMLLSLGALAGAAAGTWLGADRAQDLGVSGILHVSAIVVTLFLLRREGHFGTWTVVRRRLPRGTIASLALAALFITAQVAQNFLSDKYGLLMGGIIAGALVFAANPVQKAIERLHERKDGPAERSAGRVQEERYLAAVRLAMRDRKITREEELDLHRLAEGLGITSRRAHELLVQVEGQVGAKGRPG